MIPSTADCRNSCAKSSQSGVSATARTSYMWSSWTSSPIFFSRSLRNGVDALLRGTSAFLPTAPSLVSTSPTPTEENVRAGMWLVLIPCFCSAARVTGPTAITVVFAIASCSRGLSLAESKRSLTAFELIKMQ